MADIHVKTLAEALDRPRTMAELIEETGYPAGLIMVTIREARVKGLDIWANAVPGAFTEYELRGTHGNDTNA